MPDNSIIKVKELPEKAALELAGDDILIIEDERYTCQIKLSELSTYISSALINTDSFNKLMEEFLSNVLERLDKAEDIYPFKISNIIKTLPVNLPGKDQDTSDKYIENQNNISLAFEKLSVNEYRLTVTENDEMNSYYSGGSITDEHKWYGIIIEFNIDNEFINYAATESIGNWAEMYSIDNCEKTDVYIYNGVDLVNGSKEDIKKTKKSIIVWLRADDGEQTFCFTDEQHIVRYDTDVNGHSIQFDEALNRIKLTVVVNKYVPATTIGTGTEITTYGAYQWNGDLSISANPTIGIEHGIMYINFYNYIHYTSQLVNGIHTSGHWVAITITPPVGFDTNEVQYPKVYYDGVLTIEGWNNFFEQDEDGNIIVEDISTANWTLMFTELKREILCTIDWGIGYIDTVVVNTENATLLYPPIINI